MEIKEFEELLDVVTEMAKNKGATEEEQNELSAKLGGAVGRLLFKLTDNALETVQKELEEGGDLYEETDKYVAAMGTLQAMQNLALGILAHLYGREKAERAFDEVLNKF